MRSTVNAKCVARRRILALGDAQVPVLLLVGYILLCGWLLTPLMAAVGPLLAGMVIIIGLFVVIGIIVETEWGFSLKALQQGAKSGVVFFGVWSLYMLGMFAAGFVAFLAVLVFGAA